VPLLLVAKLEYVHALPKVRRANGALMPQIQVKVDGSKVVSVAKSGQLAVANIGAKYVKAEMDQARDEVATYPSELPNQRYVRTGKRGAATKVTSASGNNQYVKKYTLESNPSYGRGRTGNPYTVGDAQGQGQAAIHAGRWKLMRTATEQAVDRIVEKAGELFRAVFAGFSGGL